jgi:anti-sigma regulatory factor (Ser/Thr protein kinase)
VQAVISGRAGKALLLNEGLLKSFDVADPSNLASRQVADLPYLFGDSQDLRIIENADLNSIARELENDCHWNLALDLTLLSLDPELPDHIRSRALQDIEQLLIDDQLVVRLENIIYARPIPEDGDLAGALDLCINASVQNMGDLLRRVEERQSLIGEVSASWQTIPTKIFGSYENQAEFQRFAVREGLFRSLVLTRHDEGKIASFLRNTCLSPLIRRMPNYWQVLQHWIGLLNEGQALSTAPYETAEFDIVVPIGVGGEVVVASTADQIARRLSFRPEARKKIQEAAVEVFMNASEDSLSSDERLYLRFRFEGDGLIITVSNSRIITTGALVDEADRNIGEPTGDPNRRGWGLRLIGARMDKVQFEAVDDDAVIPRNEDLSS